MSGFQKSQIADLEEQLHDLRERYYSKLSQLEEISNVSLVISSNVDSNKVKHKAIQEQLSQASKKLHGLFQQEFMQIKTPEGGDKIK
jgi:Spy/CpxP family protein refolding chaperone